MIGYLKGIVKGAGNGSIILLSNDIGWDINIGEKNYLEGSEVELYIFTSMKDSDISLFGFETSMDLKLFKMLTAVSGVGGKTAMNLVTILGVSKINNAVLMSDHSSLKVPGVGAKTAQKILIELKGKIDKLGISTSTNINEGNSISNIKEDVVSALEGLGYKTKDVIDTYRKLNDMEKIHTDSSDEDIIRAILANI
ncbi:MAG: Holliday junction branch migration protein RuvA [Candidatus Dojkabacteria bacterium]|nr:Holliday junction branch migration protein RuvA [Candidatus Dojkabacteria bacterium]MDQ7021721.1 Holliday junction branch migration protein RuvA [Candidatus Dojkabacteria bacterium]